LERGRRVTQINTTSSSEIESAYAWTRLIAALLIGAVGGVGMWSVAVALPAVQAEFGVARGSASLPYALTMIGLAVGGIVMGRLSDARGVTTPLTIGALMLCVGYALAAQAQNLWQFTLIHGVVIGGLGASSTFGPLVADISLWFQRRRGIAVALVASGNYAAGALWPPILERSIATYGWRQTYIWTGLFCVATILPLVLLMRRPPPLLGSGASTVSAAHPASAPVDVTQPLGFSPNGLQYILMLAGIGCCVGMSMPQVHIVAYCGDLGYGVQRGAEMLSIMMAAGIASRLISGWISDRLGGLPTLLLGSSLQGLMLLMYLPFDSLAALYMVSALFGFVQGGIVPSYAIIVREHFPASEAGTRVSAVLMSTVFGMAVGGLLSGWIFDVTGSYRAAFLNGIAWNLMNVSIALMLFYRKFGQKRVTLANV
jgi:MFS family permease